MCNRIGSSCHEVVKLKSLAAKLKAEGTHCYLFVFGYIKVFLQRAHTHVEVVLLQYGLTVVIAFTLRVSISSINII